MSVRVIHQSMPKSLVWVQSRVSGRAGRDGKVSESIVYFCFKDMSRLRSMDIEIVDRSVVAILIIVYVYSKLSYPALLCSAFPCPCSCPCSCSCYPFSVMVKGAILGISPPLSSLFYSSVLPLVCKLPWLHLYLYLYLYLDLDPVDDTYTVSTCSSCL